MVPAYISFCLSIRQPDLSTVDWLYPWMRNDLFVFKAGQGFLEPKTPKLLVVLCELASVILAI